MPRKAQPELREETHNAIKDNARRLMAEKGSQGLSLRGIARAMDMTAPALYYYFGSMDDLITALILDAYNGLAEVVEAVAVTHADEAPYARLIKSLQAYRQWALDHKTEFQLIFGNPIPGYHAPTELTVPAATRSQIAIGRAIYAMIEAGAQIPAYHLDMPDHLHARFEELVNQLEGDFRIEEVALTLSLYTHLQGLVIMELINHLPPTVIHMDDWFMLEIEKMLKDRGLTPK